MTEHSPYHGLKRCKRCCFIPTIDETANYCEACSKHMATHGWEAPINHPLAVIAVKPMKAYP